MALLPPGPSGYPEPGRHDAEWLEVRAMYVEVEPSRRRRRRIFGALELWRESIFDLVGEVPILLGGDLISTCDAPESVVAVAVCPDPQVREKLLAARPALELFTGADIGFSEPFVGVASITRPMGGLVDAYSCTPAALSRWNLTLSWPALEHEPLRGYLQLRPGE